MYFHQPLLEEQKPSVRTFKNCDTFRLYPSCYIHNLYYLQDVSVSRASEAEHS